MATSSEGQSPDPAPADGPDRIVTTTPAAPPRPLRRLSSGEEPARSPEQRGEPGRRPRPTIPHPRGRGLFPTRVGPSPLPQPDRFVAIPAATDGTDEIRPARSRRRIAVVGAATGVALLTAGLLWSVRGSGPTAPTRSQPSPVGTAFAAGMGSAAAPSPEASAEPVGGSVTSTALMRSTAKPAPPGLPNPGRADLARRRPVTASGSEGDQWSPANAVDGDPATRWSSAFADPQWISVDLGALRRLSEIKLSWENAYAIAYRVQISADGRTWKSVYTTASGQGGVVTIPTGGVAGRHVRVYGTKRNTTYGYSLFEIEVR